MAKKSSIEKNNRRRKMAKKFSNRRAKLKAIAHDKKLPMEERFAATLKLAELPRNSSKTRIRNRCELSGRPRAYYRKHRLSRIALRELGSKGLIPGLVKMLATLAHPPSSRGEHVVACFRNLVLPRTPTRAAVRCRGLSVFGKGRCSHERLEPRTGRRPAHHAAGGPDLPPRARLARRSGSDPIFGRRVGNPRSA